MTLKYQQCAERRGGTTEREGKGERMGWEWREGGKEGKRGRQMRGGQQQVVVMETVKIVTRLTSTVLMGGGAQVGRDAEKASMSR